MKKIVRPRGEASENRYKSSLCLNHKLRPLYLETENKRKAQVWLPSFRSAFASFVFFLTGVGN